jgi:hypothetical protein
LVGVCVISTLEEMEWNAPGKGIIYRAFHFTGHRCVEKFMTGIRIDGRTIRGTNLFAYQLSVSLERSNFVYVLGSSDNVN